MDGLSVKCILYKTFVFHQNLTKLGDVVYTPYQVLSNSEEKQKSLIYNTFNGQCPLRADEFSLD